MPCIGPSGADGRGRTVGGSLAFLSAARFVINTATRFVYPFLPFIARSFGESLSAAGLLVSARWAAGLATPGIVAGVGGQQHRRLIRLSLGLFAVGALVTAAAGVYVGALVGFILMGLAKPVYDVTSQAYIADRVPYERRARYLATFELTWAGSLLIGAPAAGWLLRQFGWSAPFWVFAVLIGIALGATGWALDPDSAEQKANRSRVVWHRSAIALIVVVALYNFASEIMFVSFAKWLEADHGFTFQRLGIIAVLIGLAELAGEGGTIAFTDRIGKRRAVAIGLVLASVGFAAVGFTQDSAGLGVTALLVGILGFEFTIVSTVPLSSEMAPMARSRYLAWSIVAISIGRFVGAAAGTGLVEALGIVANSVVATAANLAGLAVLLAFVQEITTGDPADADV